MITSKKEPVVALLFLICLSGVAMVQLQDDDKGFNRECTLDSTGIKDRHRLIPSYISLEKFVIDGNWSEVAAAYGWCTGSGTILDPYVISGIEVNGLFSGSCLVIKNTNDYFEIRDSRFYNGDDLSGAGIYLDNVQNGLIQSVNVSSVYEGVILEHGCSAITICNNVWTDETLQYGVDSSYSGVEVSYNEIFSARCGIRLVGGNLNSLIKYNTFSGPEQPYITGGYGIFDYSNNNTIEDNEFINTKITIFGGNSSNIRRNSWNGLHHDQIDDAAIEITASANHHVIEDNVIQNVAHLQPSDYEENAIVIKDGSFENEVINNVISGSDNGIYLEDSINNSITGNTISVYHECIYGNAVDYSSISANECSIITDDNPRSIPFGQFFIFLIPVGIALVYYEMQRKKPQFS